jgi:hypothetical protein
MLGGHHHIHVCWTELLSVGSTRTIEKGSSSLLAASKIARAHVHSNGGSDATGIDTTADVTVVGSIRTLEAIAFNDVNAVTTTLNDGADDKLQEENRKSK